MRSGSFATAMGGDFFTSSQVPVTLYSLRTICPFRSISIVM